MGVLFALALAAQGSIGAPPRANLPSARDFADGEVEIRHVAECALRADPVRAKTYLQAMPASADEQRIFGVFESRLSNCIHLGKGIITFGRQGLRGALAGALYRRDFPTDPNFVGSPPTTLPEPWWRFVRSAASERPNPARDQMRRLILLQDISNCVVDRDPADVSALVRAAPASPEEGASFHRVAADLGPCLQTGVSFRIEAPALRAYVAESLLRKARAVRTGVAPAVATATPHLLDTEH